MVWDVSDPSKAVYWPLASWLNREGNIKVFFLITHVSFLLPYGADFGVLLKKSSGWTLSLCHFFQKATSKSLPEERAWNICWSQIFVIRYLDKCHSFFFLIVLFPSAFCWCRQVAKGRIWETAQSVIHAIICCERKSRETSTSNFFTSSTEKPQKLFPLKASNTADHQPLYCTEHG